MSEEYRPNHSSYGAGDPYASGRPRSSTGRSSGTGRSSSGTGRASSGTGRVSSGTGRVSSGTGRSAQSGNRAPGTRQRKKRRSVAARISGGLLYVLFVIGISAALATVAWLWAGDVLALNKTELSASVTLPESIFTDTEVEEKTSGDDGVETVTKKTIKMADLDYVTDLLAEKGLIQYKFLFKLFARFTHSDQDISAGTYELNTNMDYRALLLNISRNSSARMEIEVTIPEGYTVDQIFALLEKEGVASVEDLESMAATWDYKFDWLQRHVPLGDYHRLEGYLFPDTYKFYAGDDPKYVINKMLVNFHNKMSGYFEQIEESGHTLAEIVNIASMIQRETDGTDEKRIASVIYNRLNNNEGGTHGYLQIDATLVYINGGNVPTEADKAIDSLYNTYMYPGLPQGPIANPGMASLYAAMTPENTAYYYYVLGDDNLHHFFQTYQGMQDYMATQERYAG